ncbi:MAG: chloride channel protein [Candidatus Margulisiibacteriota bacterium]
MYSRLREQSILFVSVVKWIFLSTIIGVVVGLGTTLFLKTLNWSVAGAGQFSYYFLLLPFAMALSMIATKYLAPDAEGHGTEKVIEAVHKNFGKIKLIVAPVKFITTIVTVAFGGSVGKEGPCAQIGGSLASFFADIFRFDNNDRRKLVICGISAGFASVFGTPIAGAIFGVEVLFVGQILYDVLLPSFVAGIMAFEVSSALGITYFHNPIKLAPMFSEYFFIKVMLAGVFFGICSFLLIEILDLGKRLSDKIRIWEPVKALVGGTAIVCLALIFSTQYLGLGLDTIQANLGGTVSVWYSFLMKMVFTSITLGFGGSGGIITPIFFIGSTAGALFANIFRLDVATFAAIGLVSLLAGAANTPIAASIMAVELFGPVVAPYATIACIISFLMTGHRSVYPSQILSIKKSQSIQVKTGEIMENLNIAFMPRKKSITGTISNLIRKIKDKGR